MVNWHPDVCDLSYAPDVSHGADGSQGTKAVPSYIGAEAETTPLPRIMIDRPPATSPAPLPKPSLLTRLGDLPMRVIYRLLAGAVAVIVAVTAGVFFFVTRDDRQSTAAAPRAADAAPSPTAEPGAVASQGASQSAAPTSVPSATSVPTASAPATASAAASGTAPATVEPASAGSGSPAATASPTAGLTPIQAALADPRVPGRPKIKKLGRLPGRTTKVRRWLKDRRSRIAVARLSGGWRQAKPKPFATRQLLPAVKGAGHRALLVTCPVPILVQDRLPDTALLAARWTLNHQPKGAKIKWVASQPRKVGKRDAWLIAYEVRYTVKGKRRTSMAAVLLTEVPKRKPALLFVAIPDSQKRYWRDINTIVSTVKAV
jgi:hypothetical protein